MNRLLACGASLAAILTSAAAVARPAAPVQEAPASQAVKPLTRAEVEKRVEAAFAKLDTNHDGFITKEEMNAALATRQQAMEQRAAHLDVSKLFDHFDLNRDGKITTAEFDSVRGKANATGTSAAQAHKPGFTGWFAQADSNHDGILTRSEFEAIGPAIKARIEHAGLARDAMANRLFAMEDTNKDGRVSLAELEQAALAQFDRADLNHDGTITPQERQQAAQLLKARQPKQ